MVELPDYKLKTIPEDFIVEEILDIGKLVSGQGRYAFLRVKKKNRNTIDIAKELAKQTNKDLREVGFCGNKDKNAITIQYFSINNLSKERIERLNIDNCEITLEGYGAERLNLGSHTGNRFTITIRNLRGDEIKKLDLGGQELSFINYFDDQRFSSNNVEIGRCMIKKEFGKAVDLLKEDDVHVKAYMERQQTDYVGALLKLPKKMITLYLHSYQSYLWNLTAIDYILKKSKANDLIKSGNFELVFPDGGFEEISFPLVGYGTEFQDEEIKKSFDSVFKEEKIVQRDFIIRSMPDYSLDTEERPLAVNTHIEEYKVSDDELFTGRKKILVKFSLPSGSYATMFIKRLILFITDHN